MWAERDGKSSGLEAHAAYPIKDCRSLSNRGSGLMDPKFPPPLPRLSAGEAVSGCPGDTVREDGRLEEAVRWTMHPAGCSWTNAARERETGFPIFEISTFVPNGPSGFGQYHNIRKTEHLPSLP
jgi:hypothetical protein